MTDRAARRRGFLDGAGWAGADCRCLAGDASDRRYDRVTLGGRSAVLMDAPPGKGDDPADFLSIAGHLRRIGLSAPECYAMDLQQGFLLLEDLGDGLFARLAAADPAREAPLYAAATDVLRHLQAHPAPPGLPDLSAADWAQAAAFAFDWYRFAVTGDKMDTRPFCATLQDLVSRHADGPRVMILRDFHAENLLWLPGRQGMARVGLLDFQLAQMGQPVYDLVSLLQDARRDVLPATEAQMVAQVDPSAAFARSYAVWGLQRALRIIGVFARLCLVAGKPGYLLMIPRVWGQMHRNLAHPALADLRPFCALLPVPDPATLAKIGGQCGAFR